MDKISGVVDYARSFLTENSDGKPEKLLIELLSGWMIISAFITALAMFVFRLKASYGRYASESKLANIAIGARLGWFLQEVPSLLVALIGIFRSLNGHDRAPLSGYVTVFLFCLHYFQRSIIYPFLIRGGKPIPLHLFTMGVIFTTWNGYIQGHYHALYVEENPGIPSVACIAIRFIGLQLFFAGAIINIHSDCILRNLRTDPADKSYKIPQGGMFKYVSGANFFGEIVEWFGYALFAQSMPAFAFALFTFSNTAPRALEHHNWYLKKFDNYPKERRAVIPYFL